MKLTRVIAVSVIAASLGLSAVHAQSSRALDTPAEFPPASYKGKQYVDSRGCVYIRAGLDGGVTWVPRVTRDRKVICGFKPSNVAGASAAAPAAKVDKNVVQIKPAAAPSASTTTATAPRTAPKPAATTAAAPKTTTAPAATTRTTTTAKPKTTTRTTTSTRTTTTSAPKPVVVAPATTTTTQQPQQRRTTAQPPRAAGTLSPCRNGQSTHKGLKVRCGPQAQSPVTHGSGSPTAPSPKMQFDRQGSVAPSTLNRGRPGQVVRIGEVHPETRVVPRHVYEMNKVSHVTMTVPEGYRRAFDDGRLNTKRAEMTFAGVSRTNQIWTEKTPRRLIIPRVGE